MENPNARRPRDHGRGEAGPRSEGRPGAARVDRAPASSAARDRAFSRGDRARKEGQRSASRGRPNRQRRARANRLLLIGIAAAAFVAAVVILIVALTSSPEPEPPAQREVAASTTPDLLLASSPTQAPAGAGKGDAVNIVGMENNSRAALPTMVPTYEMRTDYPTTYAPLGLPQSARVDDSYFDDALFVGDSVTLKLQEYVLYTRKHGEPNLLGKARFLSAQSFSARNALMKVSSKSIHPVIAGKKMTLEDAVAKIGAKKLFLMLGMNDVGISGIDDAVVNMGKLLQRIREKCPDTTIFVQSATPRLSGTHPTTNQLFVYDMKLYDAILALKEPNIYFIDVAYVMRDEEGKLREEYCYDPDTMALHFTNEGCRQWIDYLYTHALV